MPTPTYSRATLAGAAHISQANEPREISNVELELFLALLHPCGRSGTIRAANGPRRPLPIAAALDEVTGSDPRD